MDDPKAEIGVDKCVGRHIALMGIRYNRSFRVSAWARLVRVLKS
jgi:hypothetical protein